jgi:hypothetical protein
MRGGPPGEPIRRRMYPRVAPQRVLAALDSNEGRAALRAESAIERDAAIAFRFTNGFESVAPIIARETASRFVLDCMGGVARLELAPDGAGGTELLLTHTGIARDEWHEVHAGWLNVLFPLNARLMFGVDLRNHDARRSWDQEYADQ